MKIFEVIMPSNIQKVFDFPDDGYATLNFLKDCLPSEAKRELLIYSLNTFRVSASEPLRSAIMTVASQDANACPAQSGVVLLPEDLIVSFSSRPEIEAKIGSENLKWTLLVAVSGTQKALSVFNDYWSDIVAKEMVSPLLKALNETNRYAFH
jgi:hypothetical protein